MTRRVALFFIAVQNKAKLENILFSVKCELIPDDERGSMLIELIGVIQFEYSPFFPNLCMLFGGCNRDRLSILIPPAFPTSLIHPSYAWHALVG